MEFRGLVIADDEHEHNDVVNYFGKKYKTTNAPNPVVGKLLLNEIVTPMLLRVGIPLIELEHYLGGSSFHENICGVEQTTAMLLHSAEDFVNGLPASFRQILLSTFVECTYEDQTLVLKASEAAAPEYAKRGFAVAFYGDVDTTVVFDGRNVRSMFDDKNEAIENCLHTLNLLQHFCPREMPLRGHLFLFGGHTHSGKTTAAAYLSKLMRRYNQNVFVFDNTSQMHPEWQPTWMQYDEGNNAYALERLITPLATGVTLNGGTFVGMAHDHEGHVREYLNSRMKIHSIWMRRKMDRKVGAKTTAQWDFTIDNNGTLEHLAQNVQRLIDDVNNGKSTGTYG